MAIRWCLIEKIKSLPEDKLEEVAGFLEALEAKKRAEPMPETLVGDRTDPLASVIGICEGPPDLAEMHDHYIYGIR